MKKLLQIEGVFLFRNTISDMRSLQTYNKLKLKRHGSFTSLPTESRDSIFEEENNTKIKNIRAHSGRRSIDGKVQPPSFVSSQKYSFVHIPELTDLMNVNLEPSVE